ncbi:MAG TPA: T9SS type A sorting domain-containing protein [Ignavibacteria bacterium]
MKKLIYTLAFVLIVHCTLNIENCMSQWVQINGPSYANISSLAVSGNNILAGTYQGIYYSTNNGTNWTPTNINSESFYCFTVRENYVFAGSYGVYLSTNNGTIWSQTTLWAGNVYSLATLGNNIFAGTAVQSFNGGVYLSTNNGMDWTQIGLVNIGVGALVTFGSNIIAGTSHGIYLSTNNGQNWTQNSLNNVTVISFAILGNNIFAGTAGKGVYLSTDNGTSWSQTAFKNTQVHSFAVSGNNIFAGSGDSFPADSNGVYLSTNNGTNWILKNQGFFYTPSVEALIIANNYIFLSQINHNSVWRRSLAEIIGIKQISEVVPTSFSLYQNYPNPFNPSTKIKFNIPKSTNIKISVYDITGKEIEILANEKVSPGSYEVEFDGYKYSSGIYFYRLETPAFVQTNKMILLK